MFHNGSLPASVENGVELEGEQEPSNDKPGSTNSSDAASTSQPAAEPIVETPPASPKPEILELPPVPRPVHICKPLQKVSDILAGKGTDSNVPRGVQIQDSPGDHPVAELLEEVLGVTMAVQIAEVEGLDPQSLAEAKHRPEWLRWQEAMQEERHMLELHGAWRLKWAPPDANIVSCRWVFHAKKDMARNVYRYHAHLVACGFSQVPEVDFFDTYAPVAKMVSIRTLLTFAARHDLDVHQVDIKSAYLNGEFEESKVINMACSQA